MAYDVKESWSNSDLQTSQNQDYSFVKNANRTVTIVCDTVEEANDERAVRDSLPELSETHPRLGDAFVLVNVSLSRLSPVMWEAQLAYETSTQSGGSSGEVEEEPFPWQYPTNISYGSTKRTVNIDFEKYPYDDPITPGLQVPLLTPTNRESFNIPAQIADVVITLKKGFLDFDSSNFYEFMNKTNKDTFLQFPRGTLLVTDLSANYALFKKQSYFNVTVKITARYPFARRYSALGDEDFRNAWAWQGYQKGYKYHPVDGGVTDDSVVITSPSPVILNEDGSKFVPDDPDLRLASNVPDKRVVKWAEEVEFSRLGFTDIN